MHEVNLYGYSADDLAFIATLCKKAGITPEEIKNIRDITAFCYYQVKNEFEQMYQNTLNSFSDN